MLACWPPRCESGERESGAKRRRRRGEGEKEGTETGAYSSARGERASCPKLTLASRHAARPIVAALANNTPTSTRRSMAGVSRGRSRLKGDGRPEKACEARVAGGGGGAAHGE